MEIGEKLKKARTDIGLTQEAVAAEIGVTRQSVSNWENNRAYPDIVSVIKLSDLYSVSLDDLLKEDEKMIEHLDEATNEVKSRKKFTLILEFGIYLIIWAVCVISVNFTIRNGDDIEQMRAMQSAVFYIVLPVCSLVISTFMGLDNKRLRILEWLYISFFAVMYTLASRVCGNAFSIAMSVTVFAVCAVGMWAGTLIKSLKNKKKVI